MGVVDLLAELVAIPSVFPNEKQVAEYCAERLRRYGYSVELQPIGNERFNVIASKGRAGKSIALFGHIDTVPPYGYANRNPYALERQGDKIFGLGAWDMKAGVALILSAAEKLKPSEKRGVKVMLSADEENISLGGWRLVKEGHLKGVELVITPEIADDTGGNVLEHPAPLILGRRGRVVLELEIAGDVAHGASGKGASALSAGAEMVWILERMPLPQHSKLGSMRLFVRSMHSESTSLSIPEKAFVQVDIHLVPPYTPEKFRAMVEQHLKKELGVHKNCRWKLTIRPRDTPYLQPYETDLENGLVKMFLNELKENGETPRIGYGLTVADENVLAASGVPTITWGPVGNGAHSSQEWVSQKSLERLDALYPVVVQRLLDG